MTSKHHDKSYTYTSSFFIRETSNISIFSSIRIHDSLYYIYYIIYYIIIIIIVNRLIYIYY